MSAARWMVFVLAWGVALPVCGVYLSRDHWWQWLVLYTLALLTTYARAGGRSG